MAAANPTGTPAEFAQKRRGIFPVLLMWLPLPLFLAAIIVLRIAEPTGPFNDHYLLLALNFTCTSLASILVIVLLTRLFVSSGRLDLLLFGCGLIIWALAGVAVVAAALIGGGEASFDNIAVTIHSLCVFLSGACHFAGAILTLHSGPQIRRARLLLVSAHASIAILIGTIIMAAMKNWTPAFFEHGFGGTTIRQTLMFSSILLFACAAALIGRTHWNKPSEFGAWYAAAIGLIAVGLLGVTLQQIVGGALGWVGRAAQCLSGVYFIAAGVVAARKNRTGRQSLELAVWDDHLLRFLSPQYLWSLPPIWRYGLAILIVAATTILRWILIPWMGSYSPYDFMVVATLVTVVLLGIGPGLFAAVLGNIAAEVFILGAVPTMRDGMTLLQLSAAIAIGVLICISFHTIRIAQIKSDKSEARLATFAAATFEGIVESESGRILDCNEQFARMVGYTIPELKGREIAELIAPEDRERITASINENRDSASEHIVICKNGGRIVVETHGRPILPGDSHRNTAIRDITDRKRAAEELRESEARRKVAAAVEAERQRFLDVLETLPPMICLLKRDHHIAFANRSFRKKFGEFNGRRCHEYSFGRSEPCKFCEAFDVFETGRPHSWEVNAPDGSVIEVHNLPFTDADGTDMILEMNIDITRRRHAERELRSAHEKLAARAAQLRALTAELTLTEQRERRRMAKILHDHLQQLLIGAKFRVTILGRAGDEVVRQGAREVETLLDECVAASRSLIADLSPPILHEAGLNAGLEWLARGMADKHGLFVELAIEEMNTPLSEDVRLLLFESVRELLFNAVKHAHTRSAAVSVRRMDGLIQVVVSDQGAGFDPTTLPPAGAQGGGFGLFSIRERLDLIGGRLEIESSPGKGSRFVLIAPVGQPPSMLLEVHAADTPVDSQKAQVGSALRGAKIRVILADDHAVMREGLGQLLSQEPDIQIVGEAADGQEAVDLARRLLPDVILMDISMPVLNGIEATRAIHNDYPDIRIIGLSMFEEAERAQALRDAGGVAYVTKSGASSNLVAAIRSSAAAEHGQSGIPKPPKK